MLPLRSLCAAVCFAAVATGAHAGSASIDDVRDAMLIACIPTAVTKVDWSAKGKVWRAAGLKPGAPDGTDPRYAASTPFPATVAHRPTENGTILVFAGAGINACTVMVLDAEASLAKAAVLVDLSAPGTPFKRLPDRTVDGVSSATFLAPAGKSSLTRVLVTAPINDVDGLGVHLIITAAQVEN